MAEKKEPKKKTPVRKPAKVKAAAPPKTAAKAVPAAAKRRRKTVDPERAVAAASAAAASREEAAARPRWTGVQDLRPAFGATRSRKRVGRGPGSGHGKTAGRGNKGQKSRSGYRRVPKRGFTNIFRIEYDVVNLSALNAFEAGESITPEKLAEKRLAHGRRPVKILGDGKLAKKLTVSAHKFSASARSSIEAAGGNCEILNR